MVSFSSTGNINFRNHRCRLDRILNFRKISTNHGFKFRSSDKEEMDGLHSIPEGKISTNHGFGFRSRDEEEKDGVHYFSGSHLNHSFPFWEEILPLEWFVVDRTTLK